MFILTENTLYNIRQIVKIGLERTFDNDEDGWRYVLYFRTRAGRDNVLITPDDNHIVKVYKRLVKDIEEKKHFIILDGGLK